MPTPLCLKGRDTLTLTVATAANPSRIPHRYNKLKRLSTRPNAQLVADLVAWINEKERFTAFGAPWQADAQMVYMYRRFSWIEGIIRLD